MCLPLGWAVVEPWGKGLVVFGQVILLSVDLLSLPQMDLLTPYLVPLSGSLPYSFLSGMDSSN